MYLAHAHASILGRAPRVVGNIWCVGAGVPSSNPVPDANSASLVKFD